MGAVKFGGLIARLPSVIAGEFIVIFGDRDGSEDNRTGILREAASGEDKQESQIRAHLNRINFVEAPEAADRQNSPYGFLRSRLEHRRSAGCAETCHRSTGQSGC